MLSTSPAQSSDTWRPFGPGATANRVQGWDELSRDGTGYFRELRKAITLELT
jgi:hypothetical protein